MAFRIILSFVIVLAIGVFYFYSLPEERQKEEIVEESAEKVVEATKDKRAGIEEETPYTKAPALEEIRSEKAEEIVSSPTQEESAPSPAEEKKDYFLEPRPIYLNSLAAIECSFKNSKGELSKVRGSGVFVGSDGYILTNRHIVDRIWTEKYYVIENKGYTDPAGCFIWYLQGSPSIKPEDVPPFPFFDLHKAYSGGTQYDYTVEIAYLPDESGLSETEVMALDYAVLKIKEKNFNKYGTSRNPFPFAVAPVLVFGVNQADNFLGREIVIPGFAFQATGPDAFELHRLLPHPGEIIEFFVGDKLYSDTIFSIYTRKPYDAYGGRSGSPNFYRGYVVGIYKSEFLKEGYRPYEEGEQVAIPAVVENLNRQVDINKVFDEIVYFGRE